MSSEEDVDSYNLFGDEDASDKNSLSSKQKQRHKQRVDAGEPRNSYSSIPNFSSRPGSLMSGGLYGAIFSQTQQQHFGLFPGYGSAKMLNEMLGRQAKQAQDANSGEPPIESAANGANVKMEFEPAVNVIRRHSVDQETASGDLAHHMLRNILQGKKDLLALDQELRQVTAQTPDNNNTSAQLNNNNNSLVVNNNNYEPKGDSQSANGEVSDSSDKDKVPSSTQEIPSLTNGRPPKDIEVLNNELESEMDELLVPLGSPKHVKEEVDTEQVNKDNLCGSPSGSPGSSKSLDIKRARVENIVSGMRSSPAPQPTVNGCKKRKLYHPQQHDNSAVERYAAAAAGLNLGLNLHSLMLNEEEEDEEMEPHIHQKRVEKDVLKSQLRSMQEQLAEMQQKYVQLCNRMEQQSDTPEEQEEDQSEEEDSPSEKLLEEAPSAPSQQRTPSASPSNKDQQTPKHNVSHAQTMLSQVMSKMMSAKLHMGAHPQMTSSFNGAHPLLQHMQQQQEGMQHVAHPHPAFSNAAAMYLSQKLLMEQEARLAKEADERNQHLQQMHQQQQQQAMQAQMREKQNQEARLAKEADERNQHMQQIHQQQQHAMLSQPIKTSPQSENMRAPTQNQKNAQSELQERLMRTAHNNAMSGQDLEGLADILKTEITASLSNLVDSIVQRFMHQRRFVGKQSEAAAAAAEQLNKDLLMASHILDRKSPARAKSGNQSGNHPANGNMNTPQNAAAQPNNNINSSGQRMNGQSFGMPQMPPMHDPNLSNLNNMSTMPQMNNINTLNNNLNTMSSLNNLNNMQNQLTIPSHARPSPTATLYQPGKQSSQPPANMNSVAAAALYNSISAMNGHGVPPSSNGSFCMPEPRDQPTEQNEALSLVVTPKKKRHKVTDTRITPRTVSRILAQDAMHAAQGQNQNNQNQGNINQVGQQMSQQQINQKLFGTPPNGLPNGTSAETPSPRPSYHAPPSMLPTSVAIPNPSLHESQVFSPYSPFFNPHGAQAAQLHHMHHMAGSPPGMGGMMDQRDSPPLPHPPTMLHPALLAAAHHGGSPDYGHMRMEMKIDNSDRNSDCNSGDITFDGMQNNLSFSSAILANFNQ